MSRKLIAAGVSLGLLLLLYAVLDVDALGQALGRTDPVLLALSVALLAPPFLASAWRLDWMAPPGNRPGTWRAFKLIMLACTLNMVLPSKMGDIAKAAFLRRPGERGLGAPLALVVFEKGWDVLGLVACGLIAVLIGAGSGVPSWIPWLLAGLTAAGGVVLVSRELPGALLRPAGRWLGRDLAAAIEPWREIQDRVYGTSGRTVALVAGSILIWALQLLQIGTMALALGMPLPPVTGAALLTIGILAGLLPFTFAGIGTRDAAFVLLLAPYADTSTAAALGVLFMGRLTVPALIGLLVMPQEAAGLADLRPRRREAGAGD